MNVRARCHPALARKEELINKPMDGVERQKSHAYGAIGLVISIIALVPTIGALPPDALETPYGGHIAWVATSSPLLLTFVLSFIILMRSRSNMTAELVRLAGSHLNARDHGHDAGPGDAGGFPGPQLATHELDAGGGLHAEAVLLSDSTAAVLAGSPATARSHPIVPIRTIELRRELIAAGILAPEAGGNHLVFTADHAFTSLAAAARAIRAKATSERASRSTEERPRPLSRNLARHITIQNDRPPGNDSAQSALTGAAGSMPMTSTAACPLIGK